MYFIHASCECLQNIKDVTGVGLPFAEKEILTSLNQVLDKLDHMNDAPKQVSTFIERSKNGYVGLNFKVLEPSGK
jgi:hypothetical protein